MSDTLNAELLPCYPLVERNCPSASCLRLARPKIASLQGSARSSAVLDFLDTDGALIEPVALALLSSAGALRVDEDRPRRPLKALRLRRPRTRDVGQEREPAFRRVVDVVGTGAQPATEHVHERPSVLLGVRDDDEHRMAHRRIALRVRRPSRERLLVVAVQKMEGVSDLQTTLRGNEIATVVVLVQVLQDSAFDLVGAARRHGDRDEPGLHGLHQGELADDPRDERLFLLDPGTSRPMRVARIDEDRCRREVDDLGHPKVPVVVEFVNGLHPDTLGRPTTTSRLGVGGALPAVVSFVVENDDPVAVPGTGPTQETRPHLLVSLRRLRLIDTSPSEGLSTAARGLKTTKARVPARQELLEVQNRDVNLGQATAQRERQEPMLVVEVVRAARIEDTELPSDRSSRRDDDDATDVARKPEAVMSVLSPAVDCQRSPKRASFCTGGRPQHVGGAGVGIVGKSQPGRACAEPASRPSAPRSGGGA